VLATRRPEQLDFTLAQVARQRGADAELVVATHGFEADVSHVRDRVGDRAVIVRSGADTLFGDVLSSGVRSASGDLVTQRRGAGLYAGSGVVLADHWPDMAREGFIANRVFDAVASGARVISDDVLGIADTFGDEVVVCREDDDIRGAFFRLSVDRGDAQERALAARQFAAAHSSSSRARTLVEAVVGLRRGAGPGHVP